MSILPSSTSPAGEPDWVSLLRVQVEGLRFGVVPQLIQAGRVTQIEPTEKLRPPTGGLETSRAKISS